MNRAQRRARDRSQKPAPMASLDTALAQSGALSEAYGRMVAAVNAMAARMATSGGVSPAELEALDRWALPATAAFRRATADLDRLTSQLVDISNLEGGPR